MTKDQAEPIVTHTTGANVGPSASYRRCFCHSESLTVLKHMPTHAPTEQKTTHAFLLPIPRRYITPLSLSLSLSSLPLSTNKKNETLTLDGRSTATVNTAVTHALTDP